EEQHVAAALEELGEVDAVALAARHVAHALLLVAAVEVEACDVGAALHLALAEDDRVLALADLFPDGLVGIEGVTALIDVGELDGIAHAELAGVGLLLAHEHPEEGGLAGAVRADDPHDAGGRKLEG